MNPEVLLRQARQAALEAGARAADAFHRRSHSRVLTLELQGIQWTDRTEEGIAVRAWSADASASLAAAAAGCDAQALGRAAADGLVRGGGEAPAMPPADRPVSPPQAAAAVEGAPVAEDSGDRPEPDDPSPAILDPEVLRSSRRDLEQRLRELAGVTGIARRAGLPQATQAVLRLATLERHLLTREGDWRPQRATLTSLRLRFPSAFGLSSVELVSRRLADLDTGALVPWLAAHPSPAERFQRWRAVPQAGGEAVLTLAPPVMAVLLAGVAFRAAALGRPLDWSSPAVLMDDPHRPWGPGSCGRDGDGRLTRPLRLAGPAAGENEQDRTSSGAPLALPAVRLSYREAPQPLPTNLVLERMPRGTSASHETGLHLLQVISHHGRWLLVRGALSRAEGGALPVLVEIPPRLEEFLGEQATAGSAAPFLLADAFVSTPAVTMPGWRLQRLP